MDFMLPTYSVGEQNSYFRNTPEKWWTEQKPQEEAISVQEYLPVLKSSFAASILILVKCSIAP